LAWGVNDLSNAAEEGADAAIRGRGQLNTSRNGPNVLRSGDQSVMANTMSENAPAKMVSSACRKSTAVRRGSLPNAPRY